MMKSKQKTLFARVLAFLLVFATVFSIFGTALVGSASSYDTLKTKCRSATFPTTQKLDTAELQKKQYKRSGGDYYLYTEITDIATKGSTVIVSETKFEQLTASAKQDFLQDFITVAYAWEAYYAEYGGVGSEVITEDTVSDLMTELQNTTGAGSQMMAALMADMDPDYATANRIFEPFSGPIQTAVGLLSIIIIALLGFTMALDIAYIVIPAFRMMLDGDTDGGNKSKGMAKIISAEAKTAIQEAEGGSGGSGQNGSGGKIAIGKYFGLRWKALLLLGICMLYLVNGQIWSLVVWVIDLVSGFIGA